MCSVTWAGPVTSAEFDLVELGELRALECRIGDATDREDDIVRRERVAVLEHDVRAHVEHDGRIVGVAPGGGHLRDDLAADIPGDEIVEDIAVDRVALGVPLQLRVHGGDVAGQIDGQRVLGLRQGRRGGERHEQHEEKMAQVRTGPHWLHPMSIRKKASFGVGWNFTSLRAANIITSW